jgi:hypothetical protein
VASDAATVIRSRCKEKVTGLTAAVKCAIGIIQKNLAVARGFSPEAEIGRMKNVLRIIKCPL